MGTPPIPNGYHAGTKMVLRRYQMNTTGLQNDVYHAGTKCVSNGYRANNKLITAMIIYATSIPTTPLIMIIK